MDPAGRRLRTAMETNTPLLLPGVHDALSARLAERAGYLSGSAAKAVAAG